MLWNILVRNPFGLLIEHMKKTQACAEKVSIMFDALFASDKEKVKILAREISMLEHDCDKIKQNIRLQVAKSIFLPVERRDLLHVVSSIDAIADSAEDVGVLLTLRWMELPMEIFPYFHELLKSSIIVVEEAAKVIYAMDRLLEAGFSGPDAEEVNKRIDHVDRLEHECDKAQDRLGKKIFEHENEFSPASLIMWIKIIERVGSMANSAERMADQIRIMLAVK